MQESDMKEEDQGNDEDEQHTIRVKRVKTKEEGEWVQIGNIVLSMEAKEIVMKGQQLNNLHMNASEKLLKDQFPIVMGLCSTLKPTSSSLQAWIPYYVQIFHCRGNHWVTVSTIICNEGEVMVYYSLYINNKS